MEEPKMIKLQELKSQNERMKIQKLLARNVCKITEDGDVLWNESVLVKFFEKCGFCKVDIGDVYKSYVQRKGDKVEHIRQDHLWLHLLGFLKWEAGLDEVSDFLSGNCIYFPSHVIKAIKEEKFEDVFSLEEDEFDLIDDDCNFSSANMI
jgi:hypothetical protein